MFEQALISLCADFTVLLYELEEPMQGLQYTADPTTIPTPKPHFLQLQLPSTNSYGRTRFDKLDTSLSLFILKGILLLMPLSA